MVRAIGGRFVLLNGTEHLMKYGDSFAHDDIDIEVLQEEEDSPDLELNGEQSVQGGLRRGYYYRSS